ALTSLQLQSETVRIQTKGEAEHWAVDQRQRHCAEDGTMVPVRGVPPCPPPPPLPLISLLPLPAPLEPASSLPLMLLPAPAPPRLRRRRLARRPEDDEADGVFSHAASFDSVASSISSSSSRSFSLPL